MTDLPANPTAFAQLLDAQPESRPVPRPTGRGIRAAFHYCLALLMVEAGLAQLVEARPGEAGRVCVFESSAGERFGVVRLGMSEEREAQVLESLREILGEEGYLGGEG